jgi:hypothetical protein
MEKINNAQLIEVGIPKFSPSWTNIFLKFKDESGKELWLYYSEHVDKPMRLKQIKLFTQENITVGDTMTVNYKIVQSPNKSTKLSIVDITNVRRKN